MASRTFLSAEASAQALAILKTQSGLAVSNFVGKYLEQKLGSHPLWRVCSPIQLGSWSRGELCARSDIDLLFAGPESSVVKLVDDFQKDGYKIRYRVPKDKADWSVGVEAFDVIALLQAKPFFSDDLPLLQEQQNLINSRGRSYKRKLFSAMMSERKERAKRYDSIANFLEPNLKYGAGGIRDLEQGLTIAELFFSDDSTTSTTQQLRKIKERFLKIRHFLHLSGAADTLQASLQKEAADFFGFTDSRSFMKQLQIDLADVSFLADALAERAALSKAQISKLEKISIKNPIEALSALEKSPSLIIQNKIRSQKYSLSGRKKIGAALEKKFSILISERLCIAYFRSGVMAQIFPDLDRLRGHVQHDQYHRYSVDAHTLQAVREVLRVKKHPKLLGRLSALTKKLTPQDWNVLLWTALFHDLGKGLKGDHSSEGAERAQRELASLGVSEQLMTEVTWMVQNHLLISGAAFRQNPLSSHTWTELFRRDVKDQRIANLTIFTAIDIRATNPEAWNEWKERLLFDLASALTSPQASAVGEFLDYARDKKIKVRNEFFELLDPAVIHSVSNKTLLSDYLGLVKGKKNLEPLVFKSKEKEVWVRFHSRVDRPGLFLQFVNQLTGLGLNVQEAFVQTDGDFGAYDWFKVKTHKKVAQLKKLLLEPSAQNSTQHKVKFENIELISESENLAVISFRGRDQKGALQAAATKIFESGLEITSAKVHTWGRQIEDVFTVKKAQDFQPQLAKVLAVDH